jgi:hypothetical protein
MQAHQPVERLQHQDLILWVLVDQPATVEPREAHMVQVPAAVFSPMEPMVRTPAPEEEVGQME